MKKFFLGLLVGILGLPLIFIAFVFTGHAPAATSDPPMPYEAFIAGTALHFRIMREAPKKDVSGMATPELVAGAQEYQKNCAMCHGLPNQSAPAIAHDIFPPAPQLFSQDGMVTDDPAGETYWKIKNGIRLTAMPRFNDVMNDTQMWQVAAIVARANKLPGEAMDALKPVSPAPAVAPPEPATTKVPASKVVH